MITRRHGTSSPTGKLGSLSLIQSVKSVASIPVRDLEVDYIGVIVGPDLIVRKGKVITRPAERPGSDKSIQGWKALVKKDPAVAAARLDAIIKNTYRTLMTRGQKGCYVYFVDDETRQFFENRIIKTAIQKNQFQHLQNKILRSSCRFVVYNRRRSSRLKIVYLFMI